ncbi:Na+ dependent nucleoside transporter, partial [Saprospiraceae bacterium]|nr:Na+ dependent nucleoside transporter [Saprospiraceae bacterium]
MGILRGLIGVVSLLFICYLLSNNRKKIDWRLVSIGTVLQVVLALGLLKVPLIRLGFQVIVDFFVIVISAADQASQFLFGELAIPGKFGFAFSVLPTIVFFSALSSLLY